MHRCKCFPPPPLQTQLAAAAPQTDEHNRSRDKKASEERRAEIDAAGIKRPQRRRKKAPKEEKKHRTTKEDVDDDDDANDDETTKLDGKRQIVVISDGSPPAPASCTWQEAYTNTHVIKHAVTEQMHDALALYQPGDPLCRRRVARTSPRYCQSHFGLLQPAPPSEGATSSSASLALLGGERKDFKTAASSYLHLFPRGATKS
uniref:Uncharacterized protein n=1 Tax=Steinernema glaseri TaxID=37863 RepID=A0A1I7Z150_9BILA